MNKSEKFAVIKSKTRQRLYFTLVTMILYFSFVLNYSSGGQELVDSLAVGGIPGALVMFAGLIVVFISMELLFLFLNRNDSTS